MNPSRREKILAVCRQIDALQEVRDKLLADMAGDDPRLIEPVPVKWPAWLQEHERLSGDAGNANGPFFEAAFLPRQNEHSPTRLAILCPTFLRGPLTIKVHANGAVSGSY